jgi:tetratricopeptide (TPR) repeat protein
VVKPGGSHRHAWIAGVGMLLTLTLFGGWLFARSHRSPIAPSAAVIAVLPFLPATADTALARLGRDLVITVSANLDGVGGIRAADPRQVLAGADASKAGHGTTDAVALGRDLGAGSVVVGDMVRVGSGVRLDLRLLSTSGDSQPLARASITSALDSITALTDSVTWSLLRQLWRRGDPPSPSYANLTTRSIESLRAFLAGEQFTIAGRWPEAIDAYAAAIKADSTFWLAAWRYNAAQGWVLEARPDADLARGYESHLSAFGERDRLLIELDRDGSSLSEVEWLARSRAIVNRFPDDWSAWWQYADVLHHWGPLVGFTNADARAALQRTVDLNPGLVPMWAHLFDASIGHDSAQAARASKALSEFGDSKMTRRVLLAAGAGHLPVALRDSFAGLVAGSTNWVARVSGSSRLNTAGYPAAQIDLNRRILQLAPHDSLTHYVWEFTSNTWAARGAWDSVLVAYDHWAAADRRGAKDPGVLPLMYQAAVAGAWLGGLDTGRAAARRAPAVEYLLSVPPGSSAAKKQAARVAWADGMLALLRRDLHGLAQARLQLRQVEGITAEFSERSLAGLELELRGSKEAAAESLAALDLAATDSIVGEPHDPYARSITHLAASRLMLEQGDTTRAVKLLAWHEAGIPASPEPLRWQMFAGLAYYELARIEEAQGRADLAREHYRQFLRRYDFPPPAHQHLVDSAKAALAREVIGDAPRVHD